MKKGQKASYTKKFNQEDFNSYARLSGDDNPIHVDPEFSARTKFGKTVAHGMLIYSTIARFVGEFVSDVSVIQVSQELKFPNPTFVGQDVSVQLEIKKIHSSDTVEMTTNVARSDGKMSCLGETRILFPGKIDDFSEMAYEIPNYISETFKHRGLSYGQTAEKSKIINQADLNEFLELVGDTNLLFTDRAHAVAQGFNDILIPGGLLGGIVSDLLGTQLPGRGTNWLKQKFYFLNPAYPGDEITAKVEVIRLRPEKDLVNLRTTLTNQNKIIVVDGEALVWVSDLEL